jgi:acyl transferase domain-containing protein
VFLEVGPGQALSTLLRRQPGVTAQRAVASLRRPQEQAADDGTVAGALARLWVAGARVDWAAYYGEERRQRIPLPTYPFDRQKFWVTRPAGSKRPAASQQAAKPGGRIADVSQWFYVPAWQRMPALRSATGEATGSRATWLVFADAAGVAQACSARLLEAGHEVITVVPGSSCTEVQPGRWTIDPFSRPHYDEMVKALQRAGRMPERVLHCWGVGNDHAPKPGGIVMERDDYVLFWSMTLAAQALADANARTVRFTMVTTGLQDITGGEPLHPGKAPALGVCRVIPQEHSNFPCRSVDFGSIADARRAASIEDILREASTTAGDPIVAYRGGHRWVEGFRSVTLPAVDAAAPGRLRKNGVYLITGGLGDIGLNFAEYLARTVQGRVVLLGRTGLPDEREWDGYVRAKGVTDLTALRIVRLRRIQALGGDVLVVQGDASNVEQLAAAFAQAEKRFGAVHGVVHAAGLVTGDAFRTVLETDDDIVTRQFSPKVHALLALDQVLQDRTLDFCMMVSSLSVILGGLRYAAYAAANTYLDAVTHARNRTSTFPWITVNWDGWLRAEDEAALAKAGKPVAGLVMTGAEGADAFGRILATETGGQVVVSTGDLQARIDQWVKLSSVADAPEEAPAEVEGVRLPRPNLQTEFVAPRTDLERKLAGIWQSLLALDRVGVNDSFFELGGDSLLGIQLTATVKKQLDAKVSAVTLFEAPTVASLAALIESQKGAQAPAAVDASRQRGERRRERLRTVTSAEPMEA